jgi:ABC-type nitrate/sulfonate/bicarbonate transport system substrate-binding protein
MKQITRLTLAVAVATILLLSSCNWSTKDKLTVAISPYQDIAMIVNIENLELEKKYNTEVDLQTMNWEDILPAIASSGKTVDIGFGSLVEYLTKANNINKDTKDPLLFIYPAYIYKGGGFITFIQNIPIINSTNFNDTSIVKSFLQNKIGAQKNSLYEMLLFNLARKNNVPYKDLKIFDTPMNDGLLATQNGSLDISSAGLTQITEALKNNGRVVLTWTTWGLQMLQDSFVKKVL